MAIAFLRKYMVKQRSGPKLAAVLPSILIALVHLLLRVLLGPYANVIFQRLFDTGETAAGADAVIMSVNNILSLPIPTLLLARHPVYGVSTDWYLATMFNSIAWGLGLYVSYLLAGYLLTCISRTQSN
jgi:hypothetical protein